MSRIQRFLQYHGIGKGSLFMIIMFFFIIGFTLFGGVFNVVINLHTINEEPITIYVGDSATIQSVSGILEANEIMSSGRFIFYSKIYTDYDVYIKKVFEGTYTIPPKVHVKDLIKILKL